MLRAPLAAGVVLVCLVAGCLEGDTGSTAQGSDAAIVAYFDAMEEGGRNRTIVVLREDGAADRLTYASDGSWLPRLAPGVTYDAADLETIFAPSSQHAERGGLVHRVERGGVDPATLARLQPFLDEAWPAPVLPDEEVVPPWFRPIVMARVQAPAAAAELAPYTEDAEDPEARRAVELHAILQEVAASFEARSTDAIELPFYMEWDGCLQATTSTPFEAVRVGEVVEVRAEIENCGDEAVTLDPARCLDAPTAHVQVASSSAAVIASVPPAREPGGAEAAYVIDGVCRAGEPTTIPAGGRATLARRWNGTFAACRSADDCEYRPAQAGEHGLFTFVSGQREGGYASVTLLPLGGPTAPLLIVRESDHVNATSGWIEGNFGPHCAPVGYTSEPPAVTFWYYGEKQAPGAGIVVRDWRGSPGPDHTSTFSADRMDVLVLDANGTMLRSPFEGAAPFVEVKAEGDAFVVNGTRLDVGETLTLRFAETLVRPDGTFELTSTLTFENLGRADVLHQRAGGCA